MGVKFAVWIPKAKNPDFDPDCKLQLTRLISRRVGGLAAATKCSTIKEVDVDSGVDISVV